MGKNNFRLDWNGDDAMGEIRRAAEAALTAGALIAEGQIKQLTPVDHGALRDSVTHTDPRVNGGRLEIQVGSHLDYAIYQEFGTGEFAENGAGRKGGWVYTGPDGKRRFTMGNQPQRMFRNGYKTSQARIIKAMRARMKGVGR